MKQYVEMDGEGGHAQNGATDINKAMRELSLTRMKTGSPDKRPSHLATLVDDTPSHRQIAVEPAIISLADTKHSCITMCATDRHHRAPRLCTHDRTHIIITSDKPTDR
jgi:hypothetical protein